MLDVVAKPKYQILDVADAKNSQVGWPSNNVSMSSFKMSATMRVLPPFKYQQHMLFSAAINSTIKNRTGQFTNETLN